MIALIDDYRKELLQINTFAVDTVQNYVSCLVSYCEYAKNTLKIVPVYSKGPHILKWMARLPVYVCKDHFFFAMINERRTTPRVRFFCI